MDVSIYNPQSEVGQIMFGDFDIQSAADEILSVGRTVEAEALAVENGALDARDANALVRGNAIAGAVIKGERSLLVEGSIVGTARLPCRIDMDGDVVVVGRVEHAHVVGRNIRVGAEASCCRLTTTGDVEIGGDVADVRVVAGEFDAEKRKIDELRQNILRSKQDREFIERQVRLEEKRMDRMLEVTKVAVDFSAGQIIQRRRNRVVVDLQPFYKVMGEKTEEEVDDALLEFFCKGIVGLLTRANRNYVEKNSNRQKIFMGVVRSLRELFFMTLKLDRQSDWIGKDETKLEGWLDALSHKTSAVHIRGALNPEVELHFTLPEVKRMENGDALILKQAAKLTVQPGPGPDQRTATLVGVSGEDSVLNPRVEELQGISIRVHEGHVVWGRVGALIEEGVV